MKINLSITLILLSLFLFSCASENEKKTLDEVADIYDATISYSKNFRSVAGQKTIKEFNVNVSNSIILDTLPKAPAASNIAVLTYNNWDEKEKANYSAINVRLISQKKDTVKWHYDVSLLKNPAQKAKVFKAFNHTMLTGKYDDLNKYKDDNYIPKSIAAFVHKNIAQREKTNGKLMTCKPTLVLENKDNFQLVGVLIFNNGKRLRYYALFDKANGKDKIKGFRFL